MISRESVIPIQGRIEDSYPFDLEYYYAYLDMVYNKIIDSKLMELIG